MFSHMHNDHVGTFIEFASKYSSRVELQNVVLNIPSEEIYTMYGASPSVDPYSMGQYGIPKVKTALENTYPKTQIIIPHTGQTMWFGDAKVEVMYTHEDLAPQLLEDTNNSSTMYVVNLGGERIALLGDLHHLGSKVVYKMYGNSVDVNFLQTAHHGLGGGDLEMYAGLNAETSLWTVTYSTLLKLGHYNHPQVFRPDLTDEHLMMDTGDTIMIIPLPYSVGSLSAFLREFPDE
ncbi:MAG: hypothetical protein J6B71_00855, partial [Clostridia bacterium]|nr:hypothetical protein [Clostridia bacterium]